MSHLKSVILATFCCALLSCAGQKSQPPPGGADTPGNRREAAKRYLSVVPPADLMNDVAERMVGTLPESARERFIRSMTHELDATRLSDAMVQSMVKHFTVAEIDALTQFYGSPKGRSVMKKFGVYMADVMPVIHAESRKILQKYERPVD